MSALTRRLFFALWPDETTRSAIVSASREAMSSCEGRPVAPSNYHATLAFLGPVRADEVERVVEIGRAVAAPRWTLTLDRFGHFKLPQVFWIGGEVPDTLNDLVRELWNGLEGLGMTRETRPFHLHVTLARKVRRPPRTAPPGVVVWPVTGLALVESKNAERGVAYQVIEKFPS